MGGDKGSGVGVGLSIARYLFPKFLRSIVRYWRNKGIKILVYLKDDIGAAKGTKGLQRATMYVRNTLRWAGF